MDKIWDRNPSKSEVIDSCVGDGKKRWTSRTIKRRTLKTKTTTAQWTSICCSKSAALI